MEQGWVYGEQINDKYRQHPNLKSFKQLDRKVSFDSFEFPFELFLRVGFSENGRTCSRSVEIH